MQKTPTILGFSAALAVCGALLAAFTLGARDMQPRHSPGTIAALEKLMARLERIEEEVEHLHRSSSSPASAEGPCSASNDDFARRMDAIEDQVLALVNVSLDTAQEPIAVEGLNAPIAVDTSKMRAPLRDEHAGEVGLSPWGDRVTTGVATRFETDPFFNRFPGELLTDCRQTTCRLTWVFPPEQTLTPEEMDLMLATVQYELASLAAEEGKAVGHFEVEWYSDAAEPHVSVYLSDSAN